MTPRAIDVIRVAGSHREIGRQIGVACADAMREAVRSVESQAGLAEPYRAATSQRPRTLFQGGLGVAVLVADLAAPENARMPFFE